MHNDQHIDIKPEPVKLGEGKLAGYKIADLTGTTKLVLNAEQRTELKDFADNGGTLIVDAAGGATDFADTAENELKTIFGAHGAAGLARPLPPDSAIYSEPKIDKKDIVYRSFARASITGIAHAPRLRGITVKDRIAVIYSREDLTAGLVGEPVDGIVGYTPETATRLMTNIVLYAGSPK